MLRPSLATKPNFTGFLLVLVRCHSAASEKCGLLRWELLQQCESGNIFYSGVIARG
jgi:hypothetical protein